MASELPGQTRTETLPIRPAGVARRMPRPPRRRKRGAPVAFATAGDLLRLLISVPPDTPVHVAETVRIAAGLDLHRTAAETVTALSGLRRGAGEPSRGIEIAAYVVARDAGPPAHAVPFPAYESAVEALERGDTPTVLEAQVELLEWIAATLSTGAADPERPSGATASVADPVLREQLDIEGRRLREAARRLDAVLARLSRHEHRARVRDDET